jgi:hypothetical protein
LSPRTLAGHLEVAPSTLSASIARLSKLGYLTSRPIEKDRSKHEIRLTAAVPRFSSIMAAALMVKVVQSAMAGSPVYR